MKNIPVDTSKLTTLVAGAIQAATSPDGNARRDRGGQQIFNVPIIVVTEGGSAETMTVKIAGAVAQVPPLTPVRLVGLAARAWAMDGGRSGVSFSAEALQPVVAKA